MGISLFANFIRPVVKPGHLLKQNGADWNFTKAGGDFEKSIVNDRKDRPTNSCLYVTLGMKGKERPCHHMGNLPSQTLTAHRLLCRYVPVSLSGVRAGPLSQCKKCHRTTNSLGHKMMIKLTASWFCF